MLKNEDIIYIANDWFGENKTSAHHIAEELSRHNRMLYVEAAGQRPPRASGRDLQKIIRKLAKVWEKPRQVTENVLLFSPLIIPFHGYRAVRRLNKWLLRNALRRACKIAGFKRPLLWIVLPHYASVIDDVDSKGVVYYCVDEYSSQPNVEAGMIQRMENAVLARADIVFTVSETLLEAKKNGNPNAYLSTHGVEVDHFAKAGDDETEVPADIASIPRPVAGFFGLIEDWIDLDLIRYAAESLPDVSFVMIGSVVQPVEGVAELPNVHFLGHRKYGELPAYLKVFDVGLLPYKLNTQVINSNPKKLREYLAGGKPVVSVRVREVERYGELVRIADGREQFVQAIQETIQNDSQQARDARMAAMRAESWEAKVERICQRVQEHIAEVHHE